MAYQPIAKTPGCSGLTIVPEFDKIGMGHYQAPGHSVVNLTGTSVAFSLFFTGLTIGTTIMNNRTPVD